MQGNTATISLTAFRCDWLTHMPMRELCERWTITRDQVIRLKHVWQLPPRHDRKLRAKPERQRDPTPREIKAACLRIQATWTDDVREDRRVIKTQHVSLQRIELDSETRAACDCDGDADLWEANR
jgi:hypothetical protein